MSRWISVISKNMKPRPSDAKYTNEIRLRGSSDQSRRIATKGSSRKTAAMIAAMTRSSTRTRSPTVSSQSDTAMEWVMFETTSSNGRKCQKNGSLSLIDWTS